MMSHIYNESQRGKDVLTNNIVVHEEVIIAPISTDLEDDLAGECEVLVADP